MWVVRDVSSQEVRRGGRESSLARAPADKDGHRQIHSMMPMDGISKIYTFTGIQPIYEKIVYVDERPF